MATTNRFETKAQAVEMLKELIAAVEAIPDDQFAFQASAMIHATPVYNNFGFPFDWKYLGKTIVLSTFPIGGERMNMIRSIIEGK